MLKLEIFRQLECESRRNHTTSTREVFFLSGSEQHAGLARNAKHPLYGLNILKFNTISSFPLIQVFLFKLLLYLSNFSVRDTGDSNAEVLIMAMYNTRNINYL